MHSNISVSTKLTASSAGGQGIWPAFWMLPSDSPTYCSGCGAYGSWPASGEIDIMEAVNDMTTVFGTLHYGGPSATMTSYWTHGPGEIPLSQVLFLVPSRPVAAVIAQIPHSAVNGSIV